MFDFKLPEIGENITSGHVVKIPVTAGQVVQKDQTLVELETDKASLDVPSPCDGVIKEILIREGQDVKIGEVMMRIETGQRVQAASHVEKIAPAKTLRGTAASAEEISRPFEQQQRPITLGPIDKEPTQAVPFPLSGPQKNMKDVSAPPSVRRLAREIGVDIIQVLGSGPGGRISVEDVKGHAKRLLTAGSAAIITGVPIKSLPDFSKWGAIERKAMTNIRKKTAYHLSFAWATIPHVTQWDKADITDLEKLRQRYSTPQRKLTVTPFLLKVMASALKTFPQFNASLDMTGEEIIYKKYCHIGVAVDTDRGLIVPVLRDVDQKNILELTRELNEISERVRNKKISLEELQGGCITLTNLGGIGGVAFSPIINWPEVAILGVARATSEPVYIEGALTPRTLLPLSLSYDHRLIDGADGARFLRWICEAIEQPFVMELEG
ncbi:MAG TPA: branched-chain alpha-keto acid dehydrogenase subunit E2 [Candidatus Omnitrophica bacterium]|nr:MAG: branched-chain alpha-keto acid dehydrogenase subunit E2 [Omnitrophica WOR_2 bacterium GWA2_45_18]HBR14924.1 branched-chain alpha-keto acid dehydrogenase subunit E2 [Candidatus Omnitrophota bacterium]